MKIKFIKNGSRLKKRVFIYFFYIDNMFMLKSGEAKLLLLISLNGKIDGVNFYKILFVYSCFRIFIKNVFLKSEYGGCFFIFFYFNIKNI